MIINGVNYGLEEVGGQGDQVTVPGVGALRNHEHINKRSNLGGHDGGMFVGRKQVAEE